jgi:uncharacterized protein (DUF697 family)
MVRTDDAASARELPPGLWDRLRLDPVRAPEHISLAAARTFGPQAERWAADKRANFKVEPAELAKMAKKRHATLARFEGAATGVGGIVTMVPDLVALAWIQSRMVFYIAAAYGYDPTHPMRPAELLALTGFYETPAEARDGLDGMGKPLAFATVERTLTRDSERSLFNRLRRYAIKRAAKHYGGRLIPFIGAPIGAVENAGATKALGYRALAYYGGTPQARP